MWQDLTSAGYAQFEALLGDRTVPVDGTYWRQVRPFLYRPLLVFREYPPRIRGPWSARLGGLQHAVPSGVSSNSTLDLMLFGDVGSYTSGRLDYNRRRQVKLGTKEFVIHPVTDLSEFKAKGHAAYLSFLARTHYQHGSKRRHQQFFHSWADALFQLRNVLVLGGYRKGDLSGISLSFLVEDTLFYATFFCDTPAIRLFLPDLMLHFVREQAARQEGIKQIFTGMYKGGNGLDSFYLLRGCKLVRQPARLRLNPLAGLLLKNVFPRQYRKLHGELEVIQSPPDSPLPGKAE